MLAGNPKAALALFDQGLAVEATPELGFNHALAELKVGDPTKAAAEFQSIYADPASPFRARAAYHGALALETLGRREEAEALVERSLKLDPGDPDALAYVGLLRERRGDLQGAGRAYQELLRRRPDLPFAMLRFGVAAMRAGRNETARNYFEKVVATAPASPEAVEARKYLVLWD
jgi:tetratricopeptide (TPR) repeat protein